LSYVLARRLLLLGWFLRPCTCRPKKPTSKAGPTRLLIRRYTRLDSPDSPDSRPHRNSRSGSGRGGASGANSAATGIGVSNRAGFYIAVSVCERERERERRLTGIALSPGITSVASSTCISGAAWRPYIALCARGSCWSGHTGWSCVPGAARQAGSTNGTLQAGRSGQSCFPGRAIDAHRTNQPGSTSSTNRTSRTGQASGSGYTSCTCLTCLANRSCGPGSTNRSGRPSQARGSIGAGYLGHNSLGLDSRRSLDHRHYVVLLQLVLGRLQALRQLGYLRLERGGLGLAAVHCRLLGQSSGLQPRQGEHTDHGHDEQHSNHEDHYTFVIQEPQLLLTSSSPADRLRSPFFYWCRGQGWIVGCVHLRPRSLWP
jgi:hypothetical protein